LTRGAGAAASYDRFQVDEPREAAVETPHVSAAPAIGLDSLLMLQGIDDSVERDRGARKRRSAMIAALSDLQRAMLAAEDPALTLQALSDLAAEEPDAADPALASVLRAVVLRARLEVARRGRRGD
jgi:hypothetical protein